MKLSNLLAAACITLAANVSFAKEPVNIALVKEAAIKYHDSGEYDKDIKLTVDEAIAYLKNHLTPSDGKPAIVLDIDETSLSNYNDMKRMDFGGTIEQIRMDEDKAVDPVISPTLELFRIAKANHVAVFFITGRFDFERKPTEANLKQAGYADWDDLYLRSGDYKTKPAAEYKSAMRKEITKKGYHIILNMGDQLSDIAGGYADKTYKLPNPYYFIP
jgi:acid phosphatase